MASREAAEQPGRWRCTRTTRSAPSTGQATLGVEIGEQVPDVDTVLVAVGGGGLCLGGRPGTGRVTTGAPGWWRWSRRPARRCTRRSRHGGAVDVQVGGVAADALGASRLGRDRVRRRSASAARRRCWSTTTRSSLLGGGCGVTARVAAEPAGATALAPADRRYVPARGRTRLCRRLRRQRGPGRPLSTASGSFRRARGRPTAGRRDRPRDAIDLARPRRARQPSAVAIEARVVPLDGGADGVVGQLLAGGRDDRAAPARGRSRCPGRRGPAGSRGSASWAPSPSVVTPPQPTSRPVASSSTAR